jgi:hypothetical protein
VSIDTPLGRVNDIVAKGSGVSATKFYRIETVLEKGPEELKDRMLHGKTSPNYAYKSVRRAEDHKNTPELPKGQYDVLVVDPPWKYEINIQGSPDNHYQVMENEEIEQLSIPAADNAIGPYNH